MGVTKAAGDGSNKNKSIDLTNDAQPDNQRSRRQSTQDSESFAPTGNFFNGAIKLGKSALMENLKHQRSLRDKRNAEYNENMSQWRARREQAQADVDSQETRNRMKADEMGKSLLKELRKEVCARLEKEFRDPIREEIQRNRKTIEEDVRGTIAADVRQELYQDLEPVVSAQLAKDMYGPVKKALEIDLKAEVMAFTRDELYEELYPIVKNEIEAELRVELYPIIRKEIEKSIRSELSEEIKRLDHPNRLEGLDPDAHKQLPSERPITPEVTATTEIIDDSPLYANRDDDHQYQTSTSSRLLEGEEEESLFIPQEEFDEDGAEENEGSKEVDVLDIKEIQEVQNLDPRLARGQSDYHNDVKQDDLPDYEESEADEVQEISREQSGHRKDVKEDDLPDYDEPEAGAVQEISQEHSGYQKEVKEDNLPDYEESETGAVQEIGQAQSDYRKDAKEDDLPDYEESEAGEVQGIDQEHSGSCKDVKQDDLPDYEDFEAGEAQEISQNKGLEEAKMQEPNNHEVQPVSQGSAADEPISLPNGSDSPGQDAQQAVENTQNNLQSDQPEQSAANTIRTVDAHEGFYSETLEEAKKSLQSFLHPVDPTKLKPDFPKVFAPDPNYRDRKRSLSSEDSDDDVDRAYKRIRPTGADLVQTKKRDRDVYEDDGESIKSVEKTAIKSEPKRRCTAFESPSEDSLSDKENNHDSETGGDRIRGVVETEYVSRAGGDRIQAVSEEEYASETGEDRIQGVAEEEYASETGEDRIQAVAEEEYASETGEDRIQAAAEEDYASETGGDYVQGNIEEEYASETGGDYVQGNIEEEVRQDWAADMEEEFDDEEDGEGYDDEEEDFEGDEVEDEEYETALTNRHHLNQSSAVIIETNTQETAFVIDDSDEEDAEADPEQTLIGSPAFTSINKSGEAFQEDATEEIEGEEEEEEVY